MSVRKQVIRNGGRPVPAPNSAPIPNGAVSDGSAPVGVSDTGSLVGYVRVSTSAQRGLQDPAMQLDALNAAGCARIFEDRVSGKRDDRPGLAACLDYLRPGDTLIVWRLDRLARSLRHLLELTSDLDRRGVRFRSLHEAIDTSTAVGRLLFHVLGSLAEFEADLTRERVVAGLQAARERGRVGGRPTVMTAEKAQQARAMFADGAKVATVARVLGVSRPSLYRWLAENSTGE